MLLVVVVGLAVSSLWTKLPGVLGASSDFSSQSLLDDTNAQRQADSELALSIDPQLTAAAQAKANDMVAKNYWSHNTPDGRTPWSFIEATGYSYDEAGENLAYGFSDASSTVTGWMNSPEHRANILNQDYAQVGFGIASSPDFQGHGPSTVIVALYARPSAAVATIHFQVPAQTGVVKGDSLAAAQNVQPATQLVSRIQVMTDGKAPWSMFAVTVIGSVALIAFLLRHGLRIRKLVVRGELYVVQHPLLDLVIVTLIMIGYVLTRTSGIIR